jgi:oligopeptide transport system substrate-binding protein
MPRRLRFPTLLKTVAALLAALTLAVAIGDSRQPAMAAGQPLRYYGGAVGSLDPARINDASDVQLTLQLYAGLTRLDESGDPYPSLASSWDVTSDGLTYTFHLRGGLRFSDGSALDAGDVRRSWLRLLDPQVHASAPDVLNAVAGAAERIAGRASESSVGITAPDTRTLVVKLRHRAGYFPAIVATPATFVVPRSAKPSGNWQVAGSFVGSGPYVAAVSSADKLVLRANPNYVAGAPPIGEVDWIATLDGDEVTAFSQKTVDLTGIGGSDATWVAYDPDLGRALHRAAALNVQYLGFDTTKPPFDDPRVRRAFALALDRPRLVELADGPSAVPATSVVPPAIQPPGLPKAAAADVAAARRLLDEAGYRDRSTLGTITVNATGLDVTPIVAVWRSQLGATVNVESMTFDDYIGRLDAGQVPQVFTINWVADYPSPFALYDLLLTPAAHSNYGRWKDPRFETLLGAAAAANGDDAQAAAYAAVEKEVEAQAPVIPWSFGESNWLVRPGLRGLGGLTVGLLDFGLASWDS